jgi:hypothetical protein
MTDCEMTRAGFGRARDPERAHAAEQQRVLDHLRSSCPSCLEWLAGVDAEAIVVGLAGDDAVLSDLERGRMLSAALAAAPPPRRRAWLGSGLALVAAAAVLLVVVAGPRSPASWTGSKGVGAAPIDLAAYPIVGRLDAAGPRLLRAWTPGEPLAAGELLLFRLEIDRPAYLYLVGEDGAGRQLLHASPRLGAGTHELATDGRALALDVRALGGRVRLLWLAAPEPLDTQALTTMPRDAWPALCPACGAAELDVQASGP